MKNPFERVVPVESKMWELNYREAAAHLILNDEIRTAVQAFQDVVHQQTLGDRSSLDKTAVRIAKGPLREAIMAAGVSLKEEINLSNDDEAVELFVSAFTEYLNPQPIEERRAA